MSDNIGYTPGSGAIVAADNVGGNLHQRVKISVGADGVAADASADAPLPIAAYGELIEAIEAMRIAIASLTKTIGFALPNALGQPIFEARQGTAGNLQMNATQAGTWNIGTLTTLTNQAQMGGFASNDQIPALMHLQADNLRRNITVT
jgi:hypothetical protein